MLKYIVRRLFFFIPTLIAISLLTFFISVNAPGDPVEVMLNRTEGDGGLNSHGTATDNDYNDLRHKLGFDLPIFYFSLTDATIADTLYKIPKKEQREVLKRLANEYGSWENVAGYYKAIQKLETEIYSIEADSKKQGFTENEGPLLILKTILNELYRQYEKDKVDNLLSQLKNFNLPVKGDSTGDLLIRSAAYQGLTHGFEKMVSGKNSYKKYFPALHWYGTNNQYHHWIVNFFCGEFGTSYQDKRPVKDVLYSALAKTLGISLFSIILAYLIAIPLGVHSAINKGTQKEKTITTTLFVLYSLPNFWIATMLVVFLCGGDYFSWFPAPGSPPIPDDAPLWYKFSEGTYRLILPLFCWTYGSLAFISRQMRGGILASITQDYIQTARAKGLDEKQVIWKHAMKNSLLPVITLFASIFPLAISGSFVIETIFNIPGMGKLSLEALYARDYPIIFTVMMFTAILTMLGNLIADILYALADPRISYANNT